MPLVDRLLYIYSTILIIALTSGALIDAVAGGGNLLSLLFLLPVLGYLGFQLFVTLYRRKYCPASSTPPAPKIKLVNLPPPVGFFHQNSAWFLITVGLFTMTFTAIIFKSTLDSPSRQVATHTSP